MNTLKAYYRLTKPGIIYGNIITTIAGFLFASKFHGSIVPFLGIVFGTSLIIASACVFNNYLDRNIDKKMDRTKNRALASGTISARNAIIYATILGILGFKILFLTTNLLTVFVGLIGFADYIIFYGISKRKSIQGTIIGSISGATPILAGYTAVTNRLDAAGIILFIILVAWQMPHFYAIAMYRLKDYKAAGIPVLPAKKGILETKIQTILYMVAFLIAALMLTVYKQTGYVYAVVVCALGIYWIWMGIQGLFAKDDTKWAKKVFLFSLVIILMMSIIIPAGVILP